MEQQITFNKISRERLLSATVYIAECASAHFQHHYPDGDDIYMLPSSKY